MRGIHELQPSSQRIKGPAKSEGKIEVDGTFVRRDGGLHEGTRGTLHRRRVLLVGLVLCDVSRFRVLRATKRALVRRTMRRG